MEESRKEEQAGSPDQRRQTATIAPTPPEREMPRVGSEELETAEASEDMDAPTEQRKRVAPGSDADEELSIILTHIESYFTRQARLHDLEAISFSLRHLFSRVDFLFRQALPDLDKWTAREEVGRETFLHQQIWLHLQAVNRTLDRMAPLCHLLSDVIECLLETLDNEEIWLRTFEEEDTLQLEQIHLSEQSSACPVQSRQQKARSAQSDIEPAVWERAVTTLMDRLLLWQEQHHKLASFQQQFARPALSPQGLSELMMPSLLFWIAPGPFLATSCQTFASLARRIGRRLARFSLTSCSSRIRCLCSSRSL